MQFQRAHVCTYIYVFVHFSVEFVLILKYALIGGRGHEGYLIKDPMHYLLWYMMIYIVVVEERILIHFYWPYVLMNGAGRHFPR